MIHRKYIASHNRSYLGLLFKISLLFLILRELLNHPEQDIKGAADKRTSFRSDDCDPDVFSFNVTQLKTGLIQWKSPTETLVPESFTSSQDPCYSTLIFQDPEVKQVMALSNNTLYRLFEAKGRAISSAYHAAVSTSSDDVSHRIKDVYDFSYVENKPSPTRNILPGTSYDKPALTALSAYSKVWVATQQQLLSDLNQGNSYSGTVFRFGAINGQLNHFSGSSKHMVSSSKGHLLWLPSYFSAAVIDQTVHAYRIFSDGAGVPIFTITDTPLNPDSRLGTGEVVFPAGTHFKFNRTETFKFNRDFKIVDIDVFNGNRANFELEATLLNDHHQVSLPLLFKGYKNTKHIGDSFGMDQLFGSSITHLTVVDLVATTTP